MIKSDSVIPRIASKRQRISDEALTRYGLAAFKIDPQTQNSADRVVEALLVTLETGETSEVVRWAKSQRSQSTSETRELAHAACMAIGSEVARNVRGSFREVMALLSRVEAELASTLRGSGPALEAIAA
jgi:cell division inhibitor SulA